MLNIPRMQALQSHRNLSQDEAQSLCDSLLDGAMSDEDGANVLRWLSEKGETAEEICGFVLAGRRHAERVPFELPTVDMCGTGGSGLVRFNTSTAVAFVVASAGLCV